MKFGPTPLGQALGALLGHSIRHDKGVFKKGRVLSEDDIVVLRDAGIETVMAARFEDGDIGEDEAAGTLARAIVGRLGIVAEPFTGRANIFAGRRGIAMIDVTRINQINAIHESLTVATVPAHDLVDERQMLATVKVIPFSVTRETLDRALEMAAGSPVVDVTPLTSKSVGLVLTKLPGMKESLIEKARDAVAERVEGLSGEIGGSVVCDHDTEAVAGAIKSLYVKGLSPILVFGASAIVDRNDVIPSAVLEAGGEVDHLGMPVDPGNLLMLGHIGDYPVVGVPSCARSPKLNGFDWVLQRLMADLPVSADDISGMGVGGLLKEIATRPQPRDKPLERDVKKLPNVAAIVLAAGRSTRMGADNKLLLEFAGKPMVRHVVEAVQSSHVRNIVVVTGHEAAHVEEALEGLDVRFVKNDDYAAGISTSLRTGLTGIEGDADAAIVCLGDMPDISASHVDKLIAAFDPKEGRSICVPVTGGRRGNPTLWAREFFDEMATVKGDVGAKHLIGIHEERVCEVAFDDDGVLTDVDTPEMFEAVRLRS